MIPQAHTPAALASIRAHATSDRRAHGLGDCYECAAELCDRAKGRCLTDPEATPLCELCRAAEDQGDEEYERMAA